MSLAGGRGENPVLGGEGDRACGQVAALADAPVPQGYVDGPVGAARLAELPGAVERVHDPHPVRAEPGGVVGALLGENDVTGAPSGQFPGEELMREAVARLAQHVGFPAASAQIQQPKARHLGELVGERVIIRSH